MPSPSSSNRREFLTGKTVRDGVHSQLDGGEPQRQTPTAGHTIRMSQRAMACDFSVIMNAGIPKSRIEDASAALDLITDLEDQMSAYRESSEICRINRQARIGKVNVEKELYQLLKLSRDISQQTSSAFDPTSGPLVALWRTCRNESRIPTQDQIDQFLERVGMNHVTFYDADAQNGAAIQFDRDDVELNLGAIGKGYALDRSANSLKQVGLEDFLLHGGHSSILARGDHNSLGGWPVGIGNPLFTNKRLGTILLKDQAMATSGSNIQYFRYQGKKYGHILDPRTGWPVESMLSVTVLAPTAAMADALSTAFYVMGVEKVLACCDNFDGVGVLLIPAPNGRELKPIIRGVSPEKLFLDQEQLTS